MFYQKILSKINRKFKNNYLKVELKKIQTLTYSINK